MRKYSYKRNWVAHSVFKDMCINKTIDDPMEILKTVKKLEQIENEFQNLQNTFVFHIGELEKQERGTC